MTITIKHLYKQFGQHVIFEDVNLSIPKGQSIGLIGPNGIGKTTLIRMLFHLDSDYDGEIRFGDLPNTDVNIFKTAYFMQDNRILYPQLTGFDHLHYMTQVFELPKERIDEIAEEIGMTRYLHQKTCEYSLGMKQHLLIAMALIHDPEIIVMDEPFNGLDPTSILDFKRILNQLRQQGKTLLISSHNLAIVEELVDHVYLIKDYQLHSVSFDQSHAHHFIYTFYNQDDEQRFTDLMEKEGCQPVKTDKGIQINSHLPEATNLLIRANIPLKDVQIEQISMEQLYEDFYL